MHAADFDVDAFLLSRPHTALPDLRSELRSYLANLKAELVKLINDDYEAFISLSTDLQDEGTRLEHIGRPLDDLHDGILVSSFSPVTVFIIDFIYDAYPTGVQESPAGN